MAPTVHGGERTAGMPSSCLCSGLGSSLPDTQQQTRRRPERAGTRSEVQGVLPRLACGDEALSLSDQHKWGPGNQAPVGFRQRAARVTPELDCSHAECCLVRLAVTQSELTRSSVMELGENERTELHQYLLYPTS